MGSIYTNRFLPIEAGSNVVDESVTLLSSHFPGVAEAVYVYDLGDEWRHELKLEKISPLSPHLKYPRCTGGKRRCPPEDCGGMREYKHMVKVLQDPQHWEYEDMLAIAGPGFDPEEFTPRMVIF